MIIFFVGFLIAVQMLNKKVLKSEYKVLNPVTVLVMTWCMVYIFHSAYYGVHSYTFITYVIIAVSILAFSITFWLMSNKTIVIKKHKKIDNNVTISYNPVYLKKMLYTFSFIEFIRVVYYCIYIIGIISGSFSFFWNNSTQVRIWYMHANPSFVQNVFEFSMNSLSMIGQVILGVYIAKGNKRKKTYLLFWGVLELICAIVTMSKMSFIIFIMVVAITYLNNLNDLKRQRRSIQRIIPFISVVIVAFLIFIGYQRDYMVQGNLNDMVFNKTIDYFAGPTEALGIWISRNSSPLTMGASTFSFIGGIFQTLGITTVDISIYSSGFIDIGRTSTNVFTWLLPFYKDFSYLGFVIMPSVIGVIAGGLYNQAKHTLFIDTCNAWISALLAMSFFDFMWSQTIYVFVLFLALFIHKRYSRVMYLIEE